MNNEEVGSPVLDISKLKKDDRVTMTVATSSGHLKHTLQVLTVYRKTGKVRLSDKRTYDARTGRMTKGTSYNPRWITGVTEGGSR